MTGSYSSRKSEDFTERYTSVGHTLWKLGFDPYSLVKDQANSITDFDAKIEAIQLKIKQSIIGKSAKVRA